jgi:uncharacterized protein (TIGR03000 family)
MKPLPKAETKMDGKEEASSQSAPATIVVSLPADARLLVQDTPTTSTDAKRVLITPAVGPGEYCYTLRAEIVRDGKTLTQTQQVNFRAGQQATVSFDFSNNAVASSR